MRRIELTSIALELDAADPRIVVLQPIVREYHVDRRQLSMAAHNIRKRESARRRRELKRAAAQ